MAAEHPPIDALQRVWLRIARRLAAEDAAKAAEAAKAPQKPKAAA